MDPDLKASAIKAGAIGASAVVGGAIFKYLDDKHYILRDFKMVRGVTTIITNVNVSNWLGRSFTDMWESIALANADHPFIEYNGDVWRYHDIDYLANRIARFLKSRDVSKGSVVSLVMENHPIFVACWLGAAKIGAIVALINHNLRGGPLEHSISIAKSKLVLVGTSCVSAVADVRESLVRLGVCEFYVIDTSSNHARMGGGGASGSMTATPSPSLATATSSSSSQPLASASTFAAAAAASSSPSLPNPPATPVPNGAKLSADVPAAVAWGQSLDLIFATDAFLGKKAVYGGDPVPSAWREGVTMTSPLLLVYTSGTTGLPKAATITHSRVYSSGGMFKHMFGINADDRVYTTLPLYHSAGGVVGVAMVAMAGATMVLKRKFSQNEFWSDCVEQRITVVQYIGELCRYLCLAPPSPKDRLHKVRLAVGNGLRPDVWRVFQERFGIPEIGEFYGSTEGNAILFNHNVGPEGKGAVGHLGTLGRLAAGMVVVPYDLRTEDIVRSASGYCVPCNPGEIGELLAKVIPGDPVRTFVGYYGNESGTNSKLLKDVFKKGDLYFRTGDLLKRDEKGYWYFMDRVGDTFRWKGENVSTAEVELAASAFPGVSEVTSYGVEIPGSDGRACMIAMRFDPATLSMDGFAKHVTKVLPHYAVPLFIRRLPRIDVTSTFKHLKTELRSEGANPSSLRRDSDGNVPDVWYLTQDRSTYEKLTPEAWERITSTKAKL